MTRLSFALASWCLIAITMTSIPAQAGDPTGMWLSQDGDVKIKVSHCGSEICGHIAWLKEPNDKNGKPKVDINNADASKRSRPVMGSAVILPMKEIGRAHV